MEPIKSPRAAAQPVSSQASALSAGVRSVLEAEAADIPRKSVQADIDPSEDTAVTAHEEQEEENALVSSSEILHALEDTGLIERQSVEARLPVQLDVGIPIRNFRVKNLIALAPGSLVESQWTPGEDVPVASADVQLAWSEFEVVDTQLAVRLTRLA